MPTSSGSTGGASGPKTEAPPPVILVGFMAAGKTSVGRRLAERTGRAFVDLDAEVERLAGRSIPEIFRRQGEAAFRELEARVTRELSFPEPAVVAVGGGWMARPELRDRWDDAVRVWLRVEPDEVVDRLDGQLETRPVLTGGGGSPDEVARRALADRRDDYARAEVHVDTSGRTVEEVAEEVLRRVPGLAGEAGDHGGGEDLRTDGATERERRDEPRDDG